jgi:hypothetical protein
VRTSRSFPFPARFTLILRRYVGNLAVVRQLHKQVNEENALQKSIIIMQQNSAHFEEGIVRAIQSAWQTFDEWQSRMSASVQDTWRALGVHMASIPADHEWISFSARSDHLLDPDTPLRNPEAIIYPSKEDPSVIAVHTGYLERKKRFTRTYRESYFVLSPSGFLHEYSSSDPMQATSPLFSLFLPLCTLGPAASTGAKSHKFHIEGRKDGAGSIKTGSLRNIGRRSNYAWSFRARSHEDMMEWWNDIRMLCARYLVASDALERSGPIAAAVRAAGYLSEEEEAEEEEGSSVEEEQHEGDEEDILPPGAFHDDLHEVDDDTEPPSYRGHPHGLETGYLVRSRVLPHFIASDYHMPCPAQNDKKARGTPSPDDGGGVSRRPSQRQQEKAPEGRAPHSVNGAVDADTEADGAGPIDDANVGTTGRFHESL